MSAETTIKEQARRLLRKNFVPAITALLILLLPFYIIDGTTTAISYGIMNEMKNKHLATILIYSIGYPVEVIAGFLFSPLINGYIRAHYKAAYSGKIDLNDLFFPFSSGHYGRTLRLNLCLILKMLIPIAILFSPVIVFSVFSTYYADEDFTQTVLYHNAAFLLTILSTTTTILFSLRYFTVLTVSADNPQFTVREVFAYNRKIMRERTGSAARLIFSFVPWMLLCLLILPMLYVVPYITQSRCVSAKWLTQAALEEK